MDIGRPEDAPRRVRLTPAQLRDRMHDDQMDAIAERFVAAMGRAEARGAGERELAAVRAEYQKEAEDAKR